MTTIQIHPTPEVRGARRRDALWCARHRLLGILSILLIPLGCATVAPVGSRVTGAVRQTQVGAVLPPRFTWPVSGVEAWAAIDRTLVGLGHRAKLGLIDPREVQFGDDQSADLGTRRDQSNLADLTARMNIDSARLLLIEPVIDRQTQKKKLRQNGQTVFVKAADYIVTLNLFIGKASVGRVVAQRALSPMDLAVLEDEKAVWLDLLDEATGALNKELKGVNFLRTEIPSHLRESFSSIASTKLPGLASPMAIPDTLRRLTALDELARLAQIPARGRDLEKELERQPGLNVISDSGQLKTGDLILTAETVPLRHPLSLARMRAAGVVHLEVLRDGKVLNLILEPQ